MRKDWEPVSASITILVDNTIMELIPGSKFIARLSGPRNSFLAEHGFSALIEAGNKKILLDTGATGVAVVHNLKLLGLKPEDIDMVVLSHGHNDHSGGLKLFPGKIIAHPDAFAERYLVTPAGASFDLTCPGHEDLKNRARLEKGPVMLVPGIWTTGEIERTHKWEELDIFRIQRENVKEYDSIRDDQAIVISSPNGLAIIAGCSHAGIINTIEQAVKMSGIDEVYCVIGGFHLIGPGESKIDRTITELNKLNVKEIVPIHCTGFEGIKRLSLEMPSEFEYATAGCKINL